jgi:hypothetical protein
MASIDSMTVTPRLKSPRANRSAWTASVDFDGDIAETCRVASRRLAVLGFGQYQVSRTSRLPNQTT